MAQFRKAVITEKGLALIQKTQIREIKLEFSKIATGAGEYGEDEILKDRTALKDKRQEFGISSFTVTDQKTVKMTAAITNIELTTPYYIGEIGVYASDPDEGDILYSLAVAYPGKADYLPAYNGKVPVSIYLDTYQAVSDSENVTIKANAGAYALAKDLEALREELKILEEQMGRGNIKIGAADTPLDKGDTLFVVEGMPVSFRAAAFDNLDFGASPPENGDYWAGANPPITRKSEEPHIINGKLAVSTEQDAPKDTAFLAKINSIKEREETENGK